MVDVSLTAENGNRPERLCSLADIFVKWARALIRHEYDWGGSKSNTTLCHSSSHFWTASLALQPLHYKNFPCSPPSFRSPPRSSWFTMPGTVDTPISSRMCVDEHAKFKTKLTIGPRSPTRSEGSHKHTECNRQRSTIGWNLRSSHNFIIISETNVLIWLR